MGGATGWEVSAETGRGLNVTFCGGPNSHSGVEEELIPAHVWAFRGDPQRLQSLCWDMQGRGKFRNSILTTKKSKTSPDPEKGPVLRTIARVVLRWK